MIYYLLADSPMSKPCFVVLKFSQQQINVPNKTTNHVRTPDTCHMVHEKEH